MRVVLATIGRFHSFDLARQLHQHGVLDQIYTGYPHFKLKNERLPRELIKSYPWVVTPFMGLSQLGAMHGKRRAMMSNIAHLTFDRHVARTLPECDIFHSLSRYALRSGRAAKKRGIRFALDVGSSHVLTFDKLVGDESERFGIEIDRIHPSGIERELEEYQEAEIITVPSIFSYKSFLSHGIPEDKLALVRYGVDTSQFVRQPVEDDGVFRIVFVGALSMRKGVTYLAEAFARANIPNSELILIGSQQPETEQLLEPAKGLNVRVTGHIPQPELSAWYSRANVTVLPSVEDGFAIVLLQAMACGSPIIATENSGGPDCIEEGKNGFVVPPRDVDALAEKLVWFAENREAAREMRGPAIASAQAMSGIDRYGNEMVQVYENLLARPR